MSYSAAETQSLMRLARAPVIQEPFRHIYVRDVFPGSFYAQMLEALPADSAYGNEDDYPNRRIVDPVGLPFWGDLYRWMEGPYIAKLMRKFSDVRDERFGNQELTIGYNIRLVRDSAAYWLKPHTDVPEKFLSFLFYLPRDDGLRDFGTTIYTHRDSGFLSRDGRWNGDVGAFSPVWTAPFMPNTCFGFARTDRSFHGVVASDCGRERDALLLNIYASPC